MEKAFLPPPPSTPIPRFVTWPSQPQNWGEPGSHLGLSLQSRWSVCPGYTPNVAALRAPAGSAVGVQTIPAPGQEWLSGSWFTPRSTFSEFNEQSSEEWRGIQDLNPASKNCMPQMHFSSRGLACLTGHWRGKWPPRDSSCMCGTQSLHGT